MARSLLLVALVALAACSTTGAEPGSDAGTAASETGVSRPDLRQQLLDMKDSDQAERTGASPEWRDEERAAALSEIIDEQGWPTPGLVGEDGVSAAWLIAQHADFDAAFQQRVLDLMRPAVEAGDADPSELAFLEDRVAVNTGQDQTYGSQIRCVDGRVEPAVPIAEPEAVDERRAAVGLEPLADYLAIFETDCSDG